MAQSYIPTREADLLSWSQNLYDKLTATPADYGLTAEQVVPFAAAQEAFKAAYAAAIDPATRTTPIIADKNTKKKAMIEDARLLVSVLQGWPEMTDQKRETLEIPVRDYDPTPIGPPTEMPVLRIAAVNGPVLDLELRQEDGENKRKPDGVRGVWIYTHVGDNPPAELTAWQFRGGSTKSNPQVVFDETVAPGTRVWVTAQWVSPTDRPGPACAPQQTRISYQGLSEAA